MSNSKVLKSYRITLDDKNYKLSPELFDRDNQNSKQIRHELGADEDEGGSAEESPSFEERKAQIDIEIETMRQEMIIQCQEDTKEMMENAKVDSQKIIADAYSQAQEILENAQTEGFSKGEQEGFEQGRGIADELIVDAMTIKESLQAKKNDDMKGNEETIVNLIISICERILNKRIESDYELIEGLVQSALDKCVYTQGLVLRVASHDYDYAISSKNKFLALAEGVSDIDIREDISLEPGSCVIDSESGSIDSSIWTQFEHIRDKYIELLRSE